MIHHFFPAGISKNDSYADQCRKASWDRVFGLWWPPSLRCAVLHDGPKDNITRFNTEGLNSGNYHFWYVPFKWKWNKHLAKTCSSDRTILEFFEQCIYRDTKFTFNESSCFLWRECRDFILIIQHHKHKSSDSYSAVTSQHPEILISEHPSDREATWVEQFN